MLPRMRKSIKEFNLGQLDLLAAVAALLYFLQSKFYASTQLSVLDEGAYLLKGFWFATGQYVPYQEFGPFTNHMPLAFLIPGYIQAWFGPGLATARAFAIIIGMIFILGLWLLTRRWGGSLAGALSIGVLALNPALIKIYSVAVTQGLIVALLVWTLYYALGANRKQWHINLGVALAALMALTRLNMSPVLFLLLIYIFWQHGRKIFIKAAIVGLGIWLLGHALYWPGILQMWANYTPHLITPFLDPWRVPAEALPSWTSGADVRGRILSLLETLRFHFVPLMAAATAWLFWPKRSNWRSESDYRAAYFVSFLLAVLLGMHAIASLGADYCVFCFPLYTAFYSVLGILLLIMLWPHIGADLTVARQGMLRMTLFLFPVLVALGSYFSLGSAIPPRQWVRQLLITEVPRISGGALQSGRLPFWGLLENRFGHTYVESFRLVENVLAIIIFGALGILVGLIILRLAQQSKAIWHRWIQHASLQGPVLLLVLGALLSPSALLGGGYQSYDCDQNIIQAYEQLNSEMAGIVESGDLIFWRGGRSAVPLLYLDDVYTFPPQLNGDYTYRLGGEAEPLARAGLWGSALLDQWLHEADIILIERDLFRTWLQEAIENGPYELKGETQALIECSPRSEILIYEYAPQ